MKINSQFTALLITALAVALPGCKTDSASSISPTFAVLDTTVVNGDTWLLNRPIDIYFDNAIDFNSVSTSSVIFRATDTANLGIPVTGTFELIHDVQGRADHAIRFTPSCPSNLAFDNGGFVPGNIGYELLLPTESSGGYTVVRDIAGHPLSVGLTRRFVTPSVGDTYFYDPLFTPPQMTGITGESGLGLLSMGGASFSVHFDQGISPSPDNFTKDRIYVEYSDALGSFPLVPQIVPGNWVVVNNCGETAELLFQVSGVLLPGRSVRAVTTSDFEDLSGDKNSNADNSAVIVLETLAEVYTNISVDPDLVTYDQFIEDYAVGTGLDYEADLPQPSANIEQGQITASFVFPDDNGSGKIDFHLSSSHLEFNTTGTQTDTDDFGNIFTVVDGVMYTDNFTIDAGASIRAFGDNPLIIYVAGDARIEGEVDASGFNANEADGLSNRHDIVVVGGQGVCGGGNGGNASSVIDFTTPLGDNGGGPFGTTQGGGGGGEGGYQQDRNPAAVGGGPTLTGTEYLVASGGGGGAFALTRTDAVFYDQWPSSSLPSGHDNAGPDLRIDRHTIFNSTIDPDAYFVGAENGLRGSAIGSGAPENFPPTQSVRGYQDQSQDPVAVDTVNFDPAQTGISLNDNALYGTPVNGPDGGFGGSSVFNAVDPIFGTSNDFYGERYFWDGTPGVVPVTVSGELFAPHAGSGGGASGDLQTVLRYMDDGQGAPLPLTSHYPDLAFPQGTTQRYFRGAGGGGGGGQIQIHVIGHIILGPTASLKVNGGNGTGGDSTSSGGLDGSTTQVSGSGGGSGGHLILSSASGLNLTLINVGTAGTPGTPSTFFDNLIPNYVMQAIGGRRGWAASKLAENFLAAANAPNNYDGNGSFQTGRGGAGASGVIQIHLPNPLTDIAYHSSVEAAFKQYITLENLNNPVVSVRQDDILALYSLPTPFTLMPFFSPQSQVQSVWIDTGLAGLRQPITGTGPFPNYDFGDLDFDGLDAFGHVKGNGNFVDVLADIYSGASATVGSGGFSVTVATTTLGDSWKFNPQLLIGCDFVLSTNTYEIISATLSTNTDLVITTLVSDGEMVGGGAFSIRNKFFGISSGEIKDKLPASSSVRIQFQGADAISADSTEPDTATLTEWTGVNATTLDNLDGKRFIRYRVTFDIDALNQGGFNALSRPTLGYLKIPYAW
ncbi:MAG: hypothetical protein ACI84O_000115 [Myxococcota bacterium]|jgi:hypothetical protein